MNILGLDLATAFIAFLIVSLCLMAVWASLTRLHPDELLPSMGRKARGIYLELTLRDPERDRLTGRVTELGLRRARFVSAKRLAKGDLVELDLSSLPGFPVADVRAKARVVDCEALDAESSAFLVEAKFDTPNKETLRHLALFVEQLASPRLLSHA